jgi:hypothetical protein
MEVFYKGILKLIKPDLRFNHHMIHPAVRNTSIERTINPAILMVVI